MSPTRMRMRDISAWLDQDRLVQNDWFHGEFLRLSALPVQSYERSRRTGRMAQLAQEWADPEHQSFWLAQSSVLRDEEECFGESNDLIERAIKIVTALKDEHNRAVLETMHAVALGKIGENWRAADCAGESLLSLTGECNYNQCPEDERKKFLTNIACEMLESPIDVYQSLFVFEKSHLGPSAQQLKQDLRNRIETLSGDELKKQANSIYREMTCFVRATRQEGTDKRNYGEATAFCGMMNLLMGEREKAVENLKDALPLFDPFGHAYPMINWLIGTIEADIFLDPKSATPVKVCNLINGLQNSIRDVEALRLNAQKKNQNNCLNWYSCQHKSMNISLAGLIGKIWPS